jgi:hypothetical protein
LPPFAEGIEPVRVSVIIVNYETSDMVRRCLASIRRQSVPLEVIVVDNPSALGDARNLSGLGVTLVRNERNVGYGMGVNAGAAVAAGDVVCVLNPDTVLADAALAQWVDTLDAEARRGQLGCLAPQLVNDNGTPLRSVYGFVNPANYWLHHSLLAGLLKWIAKRFGIGRRLAAGPARDVGWAMGAAMMFPRRAWDAVGGFSPDYFLYAEDIDICWRLHKAGFMVRFAPEVCVTHSQGDPGAASRDVAAVRLFTGLRTFIGLHYRTVPRLTVRACVIADMLGRIALFGLPAAANLGGGIFRSRVRGYFKVLALYLGSSGIRTAADTRGGDQ